ncbi:xanthine dehydrogenase family protein molybdopterin-binding subunit [Candidatus Eisenbacteria bacterium]|uniref:Xanthine dehydrogenase family protein molybdopterin-binding subunit n=1 Tax=Eiseniibacteriota bacterium TaxID=2212470 RepID=A0ABV6YQ00_UNCEI
MVWPKRPHALISKVDLTPALSVDGVVAVADGSDVPGENRVGVFLDDQPLFATDRVRYEADCIAIVAAESPEAAIEGASCIKVDFEDLAAVGTPEEASAEGAPLIHEKGNLAVDQLLEKGEVARGEAECAHMVDQTFYSPVQEHAYLEPMGAIAVPGSDGSMEIHFSGQCPFYVRDAVARSLGLPLAKVRVVQLPVGGGFGGKEDVPSEICSRLAVLAAKCGRPVKMVLTREEDILYSSKRHPIRMRYRMGCDEKGLLKFANIELMAGVGAYATLSPIVLFRSTVHAAGPYDIPNVRISNKGFYTNTAPKGAMRGFGTPQVVIPCEAAIDELAGKAGIDPVAFRKMNALKVGGRTATGQVLDESVGFVETLEKSEEILEGLPGRFEARKIDGSRVRARGIASMFYGVSLGAIGRRIDRGGARVELMKDGSVSVFVGCVDMGQGALTVLSQLTAEALGVDVERVTVNRVDTHIVPDSGPTVASRTTVICGNAIIDACARIRQHMLEAAATVIGEDAAFDSSGGGVTSPSTGKRLSDDELLEVCADRRVDLVATGWYVMPECNVDNDSIQGKAYYVYSFATDIAEVEVDLETGEIKLVGFWAISCEGPSRTPIRGAKPESLRFRAWARPCEP